MIKHKRDFNCEQNEKNRMRWFGIVMKRETLK